jgi:hypothetical protein
MPILILILLAVLIAQIGFWDTLGALLGATAMIILMIALAGAIALLAARSWFLKVRRRL